MRVKVDNKDMEFDPEKSIAKNLKEHGIPVPGLCFQEGLKAEADQLRKDGKVNEARAKEAEAGNYSIPELKKAIKAGSFDITIARDGVRRIDRTEEVLRKIIPRRKDFYPSKKARSAFEGLAGSRQLEIFRKLIFDHC